MSAAAPGRWAVYFTPARHSPWWHFGAGWLGRDEASDAALPQPCPPGWSREEFARLTEEPRRYGLHATLRAPFRPTVGEAVLRARVHALAGGLRAVPLPPLAARFMDGFVALVPTEQPAALGDLGARCVTELDDLRAPLTASERARRRPEQLDARGRELLDRYGYPLVLERFRFHLTLTGPCDAKTAEPLVAHLAPIVATLNEQAPPVLDRLCLFHEPEPGAPFLRMLDVELAP